MGCISTKNRRMGINEVTSMQNMIYEIRGYKVMLDSDLALLMDRTKPNEIGFEMK